MNEEFECRVMKIINWPTKFTRGKRSRMPLDFRAKLPIEPNEIKANQKATFQLGIVKGSHRMELTKYPSRAGKQKIRGHSDRGSVSRIPVTYKQQRALSCKSNASLNARPFDFSLAWWLLLSLLMILLAFGQITSSEESSLSLKVGVLLEESDHEQANMFIRTIKMINERRDETIRRLLNVGQSSGTRSQADSSNSRNQIPKPTDYQGDQHESQPQPQPQAPLPLAQVKVSPRESDSLLKVKLEPVIEFLADRHDSLEADAKVCQLIESGVRAIVGPSDGNSIQHVQSICDNLEIPYFELRPFLGSPNDANDNTNRESSSSSSMEFATKSDNLSHSQLSSSKTDISSDSNAKWSRQPDQLDNLSFNLYPPAHLLNSAYIDLIEALNWTSFAIVYEDGSSMIKLQDLFRESSSGWTNKWRIKLFKHDPLPLQLRSDAQPQGSDSSSRATEESTKSKAKKSTFRDVFWRLKASGERNILLDVKTENLYEALKNAQQVGLMTEEYSYLITSLDLHTIDLEDFRYSRTKMSGFSLMHIPKLGANRNPPKSTLNDELSQNDLFDEKYLEHLGVHMIPQLSGPNEVRSRPNSTSKQVADSWPSLMTETMNDNDMAKREMLQSSPASMGLLPTVDRLNERKLFDFLVKRQERESSHVRLSTSSAILHDSLILYLLALKELDASGELVKKHQQSISCSTNSNPWPIGSSLANYMRRISFTGLTGDLHFDQTSGLRSDFKLNLIGLAHSSRPIKVGEWFSNKKLRLNEGRKASKTENIHSSSGSSGNTSNSYEQLSNRYELELKRYIQLLADGNYVVVPFSKQLTSSGSLVVNEILFDRLYREQSDQVDTLIVTSKLSQPYFMLKETPNRLEGNDQFEGYAVDLIHELSKLVNFRYKWRVVGDGKYGSKELLPNGTIVWNGMIGEIVRGQADLAIVDLTITAQREEAVDFTLPFMNTGISILFKKPTTKVTTLFSFLSPFSSDVWAYVLAAYCSISAILFFVGHLSPYEWANPHPCRHLTDDDSNAVLRNQFSLLNSFWFTIGSLMQQGSDLTPRSMSTRTIAGIWYFFTLIMISSYTANLAAFLTVEKVVYPIENVRDLSNQQEIKYGCVESGSTCTFFHDSQIDTYKRIDETMRKFKTYVRSNDDGQKRVGEGKFAFFMESTTIEYIIERNCNLTQIGGLIDSKGYGLATSKKSRLKRPYRTLLNEGILHLQETGMLHIIKNRWWKERRGGGTCTDDGKGGGVTELSLANVGGVFVVLLGGLGISFLVAIAEFMWRAKRNGASRNKMCEDMMSDLKFALACKSSTKPITNGKGPNNNAKLKVIKGSPDCDTKGSLSSRKKLIQRQISSITNCEDEFYVTGELASQRIYQPSLGAFARPNGGRRTRRPHESPLMNSMLAMIIQQQNQMQNSWASSEANQLASRQLNQTTTDNICRQPQVIPNSIGNFEPNSNSNSKAGANKPNCVSRSASKLSDCSNSFERQLNQQSGQKHRLQQQDHRRARTEAGRRRLLFAQQTMTTATMDESNSANGQKHQN